MTAPKLVDVEVLGVVYDAAKVRLKLVQASEKAREGAARTTMADVGRSALKNWKPPKGKATPTRVSRAGMKPRAFRFHMPADTYLAIKERIRASGFSVAGVVQDGLEHFARSGEY